MAQPPFPSSARRFHLPFEHGAWWSFFSTLAGGAAVALWRGADPLACLALGVSFAAGFVAQDWAQAVLAAALGRRSQALSQWQAWQGWALGVLLLGAQVGLLSRLEPGQRVAWGLLMGALAAAAALGLLGRILQGARGRRSLALTALLLASPALPFGLLAFGWSTSALLLWAWPLAYYPAATLSAQSFIRGFPQRARWIGPALAALLGALAAHAQAWPGAGLLLAQGLRLDASIRLRWSGQPEGPPAGRAIRAFGREQAAFGVLLTVIWAFAFARM